MGEGEEGGRGGEGEGERKKMISPSESGNREAFSPVASMHTNQQVSLGTILFILPRKQKRNE